MKGIIQEDTDKLNSVAFLPDTNATIVLKLIIMKVFQMVMTASDGSMKKNNTKKSLVALARLLRKKLYGEIKRKKEEVINANILCHKKKCCKRYKDVKRLITQIIHP